MSGDIGIIGDIHGDISAVESLIAEVLCRTEKVIFVGDYINRGPDGARVLDFLIALNSNSSSSVFLAGNHERELLRYIDGASSDRLISIGGASTLRSYLGTIAIRDQLDYRSLIPKSHIAFLRELDDYYADGSLIVTHSPNDTVPSNTDGTDQDVFHVAGHIPQRRLVPKISSAQALIDTGCGTWPEGRLTCLFWPSKDWIQVDSTSSHLLF